MSSIRVTAGPSTINGWRVTTNPWNGVSTGTGAVLVTNASYDGHLTPEQATEFGFQASGSNSAATVSCTAT